MRRIILYSIIFFLIFESYGQDSNCSVIDTDEPGLIRPYVGNNRFLLGVHKDHGIFLHEDYYESLDSRGLYKGRSLEMKDLRKPIDKGNGKNKDSENSRTQVFPGTGSIYYLPVRIYNYANSSGEPAFTNQQIYNYFAENFKAFRTHVGSIEFYIKSIEVFNNSTYFDLSEEEKSSLFAANFDGNALNVHLVRNAPFAGSANRPGRRLVVSLNQSDETTLTHEFGHNFSLTHTHGNQDNYNATRDNCGQEPVSRYILQGVGCFNYNNSKKCETNGDGFCDTPADPNLGRGNTGVVNSNCNLVISNHDYPTDNWGATWVTDPNNVMSYAEIKECRGKFSYSQAAAMFYELQTSKFNFKSTSANHIISGPSLLCPNATYTFTAPTLSGANSYQWQVPDGWTLSGQGGSSVTVTVPNWDPGDHNIYVNAFPAGSTGSIAPKKVTFNDSQMNIKGPSSIADDGYCRSFFVDNLPGLSYYWYTSEPAGSGITICSGQNSHLVTVSASGGAPSFYLNVSTPGLCGIPANASKYITVSGDGGGGPIARVSSGAEVLFYPNPVISNQVNFRIPETADTDILNVTIMNSADAIPVMFLECWRSSEPIDVSTLKSGVYIVNYVLDGKIRNAKLIIQ